MQFILFYNDLSTNIKPLTASQIQRKTILNDATIGPGRVIKTCVNIYE